MSRRKHPLLHDFDERYVTPRSIIYALRDAAEEMSFSNYHDSQFRRAEKIIRQWCKQNKVPLGPTKEAIEKRADARNEKLLADLRSDDLKTALRAMKRIGKH